MDTSAIIALQKFVLWAISLEEEPHNDRTDDLAKEQLQRQSQLRGGRLFGEPSDDPGFQGSQRSPAVLVA
jgi:hypothetical protein